MEATVSIAINPGPDTLPDSGRILVGESIVVSVLDNDTDQDGVTAINRSSIAIVTAPNVGQATATAEGTIQVTPPGGFRGHITFEYIVADQQGAISRPTLVTIEVVDSFHQNATNRFDVNNDGSVTSLDVLVVINLLARSGGIRDLLPSDPNPPYVDVDGNRSLHRWMCCKSSTFCHADRPVAKESRLLMT